MSPSSWFARSALVLVSGLAACLTVDDADFEDEGVIESELGDADLYRCAFPMCGGAGLTFDARALGLESCRYDARAGVLACEADATTSPAMPSAFWDASAMRLSCAAGMRFSCTQTAATGLASCVCGAGTATAGITYGPVITIKPKG